ncbi:MAG: GNAT family N-acetyltransferase, partial [Oscillospiraceae bacterium]|nr:GNAT family N-acetyltransferase [Oscillospiraceae bacterium]
MEFITAKTEHLDKIWEITLEAKAQLKRMGLDQWQKGYPEKENWLGDIKAQTAYLAVENGKIVGAFMLLTKNEPSYDIINGKWLSDAPYASLHRVCVSDSAKGRGVAGKM